MQGIAGIGFEQFHSIIVAAFFSPPTQPFVNQAGVVFQFVGHLGDGAVDVAAPVAQHPTGLGQGPGLFVDPPEHAPGRPVAAFPKQAVEALLMIDPGQEFPVAPVKGFFLTAGEILLDPGHADQVAGGFRVAAGDQRRNKAGPAWRADRRIILEPGQQGFRGELVGHRLFGPLAQPVLARPVGMVADKSGKGLKRGLGAGTGVIDPFQDVDQVRILDAAGDMADGLPFRRLHGLEGRLGVLGVGVGNKLTG